MDGTRQQTFSLRLGLRRLNIWFCPLRLPLDDKEPGTDSGEMVLFGPEAKQQFGHLRRTCLSLGEGVCVLRK